jgi:hypothetical protein
MPRRNRNAVKRGLRAQVRKEQRFEVRQAELPAARVRHPYTFRR